jgi:hypothetical protein
MVSSLTCSTLFAYLLLSTKWKIVINRLSLAVRNPRWVNIHLSFSVITLYSLDVDVRCPKNPAHNN